MRKYVVLTGVLCVFLAGCGQEGLLGGPATPAGYVKPTIAVMRFHCNAAIPFPWNVGDGLKDVLADRLLASDRFRVIERPDLPAVTEEVQLQQSGLTRRQQRVTPGRFKNAQYLVKGTVVDFGHVSRCDAFLDWTQRLFAGGATHKAVVSLMLQVVDVESGEILCSEFLEESVRADSVELKAAYKDVAFGGSVFWRKPLGEAMSKVVDKCVRRVASSIAGQPWTPRVAGVQNGQVLINGGRDRRLTVGMAFDVYEQGEPIVDPDTGDVIGSHPGKPVGQVEITEVYRRYSAAAIVQGDAGHIEYGQRCAKAGAALPVAALPARPPKGPQAPITPSPTAGSPPSGPARPAR